MITRRFGERGVVLGLFAIPFIAIGANILLDPIERFSKAGSGGPMDSPLWGWAWIGVGISALIVVLIGPQINNVYGYSLLASILALWTASYCVSAVLYLLFDGESGKRTAYLGIIIYGNFLVLVLYLARHLKNTGGNENAP